MAAFDRYIVEVLGFAESMQRRGCACKQFDCPEPPEALCKALPIAIGSGANPGIILRGDAFLELGNPTAGSCSYLLWTDEPATGGSPSSVPTFPNRRRRAFRSGRS